MVYYNIATNYLVGEWRIVHKQTSVSVSVCWKDKIFIMINDFEPPYVIDLSDNR